jgi:pimeloyl-ACP methyl ester carboxylesterase
MADGSQGPASKEIEMMQWTTIGTIGMLVLGLGACRPTGAAAPPTAEPDTQSVEIAAPAPASSGHLEVNGIRLWHEVYGDGPPVIVLHGGLMTIPEMMPLIAPLSKGRKVVAVELQGHGRSPDTERPLTLSTLGDDVAAIIDALQLGKTDIVGYSFGADAGLRAAIQHPDKVRRLVVVSTAHKFDAWYPEVQQGMASVSAGLAGALKDTPTGRFAREWPDPKRFPQFLDKMGRMMGEAYDWSADVARLPMPVMLAFADHDSVSQRHIADFFALLGGGISEPGWQNTKFTKARLAIIPGYSHYNFIASPELPPAVERFLADPMTNSGEGAVAASKAAPATTE